MAEGSWLFVIKILELLKKSSPSGNKRIAKNTLYLYIRMLLTMVVSLYASRVVLQVLGVVDFGIYGVVGGVVSLFTFINSSMSGATSRFITIEIGKKDDVKLATVFNMAFYEHFGIALIILIVSETIGLWFFNTYLVIPEPRLSAANWVYQMSVVSMMVSVTQVPYRACIIAHERMDAYAVIEIFFALLKLIAVFLLLLGDSDKLILYSFLILCATILSTVVYRVYCIREFNECRLKLIWHKELFYKMISYSGWDLYGNLSNAARHHGVALLLNLFFGPAMNAASSIASQVGAAVMSFGSNTTMAVKPQIIKYYAQGKYQEMSDLIHQGVRVNFLILLFISVPIFLELDYIMSVWLEIVPDYSVAFCSLILVFNFFANTSNVVITGVHATGNIKKMSFILGSLYLTVIPASFVAFKLGAEPWVPFLINVCAVFCGMMSNAILVGKRIPEFSLREFFVSDVLRCIATFCMAIILCGWTLIILPEGFVRIILNTFLSIVVLSVLGYKWVLPEQIASVVKAKIVQKWNFL